MENILSKRNQRHLDLLDFLATNKGWSNISELAEKLNCSYQSLSTDIKYLNDMIAPFSIRTSQKYGVSLVIPPNQTIGFLYQKLLADSFEFKLLETLFFDASLSLEDLSEQLFISSSTLTRTFSRLRKNMAPYQITLSSFPSQISGDELLVRYFFMNYFLERYTSSDYPFSTIELETIEGLLITIFDELGFGLSFPQLERLKVFSLVSLTRIRHGHQIDVPDDIRPELKKIAPNVISDEQTLASLSDTFNTNFDSKVIFQILVGFLNPELLLSVADIHTELDEKKATKIKKIKHFLELFIAGFKVNLPPPDSLIYSLYNLEVLFVEHDYLFFNKHKQFAENIAEIEPIYMQQFERLLEQANPFDSDTLSEDFKLDLFHATITKWPGLIDYLNKPVDRITVGVFGEFDYHHSQFIADLLNEYFSYCATFTAIHVSTLKAAKEFSKDYDLFVTNFSNVGWLSQAAYTIQLAPSPEDLVELRALISELSLNKRLAE